MDRETGGQDWEQRARARRAVLRAFELGGGGAHTVPEIAALLATDELATRRTMWRMHQSGELLDMGNGRYRLAERPS